MNQMTFGLEGSCIEAISYVFASFPQVKEVVIYGSRAKGNYKPGSDIDFALKTTTSENNLLNNISLMLDELYLPYTFNLLAFESLSNKDLIDHIERAGKVFYRRAN